MHKIKYILIAIIFLVAALIEASLRYITPDLIASYQNHPFIKTVLEYLAKNAFATSLIARTIWVSQVILGILLYPRAYIRKINENIIGRIYSDLFGSDIKKHRITLFKEISYPRALWRHICAVCYHLRPKYISRFIPHLLYFPFPGNYLMVDMREGVYKKSRTMFKVEENSVENCEGIVGLIRFQKGAGTTILDLPDITDVNLDSIDISNLRRKENKVVKDYMDQGHINNVKQLKRIHMRARHFLGSVIYKKGGKPWGMLLVDSTNPTNPFSNTIVDKFKIYSNVLTELLS